MDVIEVCPECRAGKHANCPGWSLNEQSGEMVDCPCTERMHR